ncbi:MAG: HEAT repeat domain-containing protein [Nannocystaceae bacterium]
MQTQKPIHRVCKAVVLAAILAVPAVASAGKGASYGSLRNASASNNRDSILAEVERAEKLPCAPCVDLITPLIDHDDAAVRDVAAWWLAKRGIREQVRDQMFARLTGADSIAARNAAEVLGRFAHPDALMPLELAIHDDSLSEEARAAAATAVGSIGDYRGKDVLEGAITSESAAVREAAARGLRAIRGNVDAVVVVELLGDAEETVVREAVLTVGALREASGIAALSDVVRDRTLSATVRRDAAWALGKIGDGSARDVLKTVEAQDESMLVRGAARAALGALR